MLVLVVIPTYNEKDNIPLLLKNLLALEMDLEVLIVDDASPDGTGQLVDQIATRNERVHVLHRSGKMGLGSAYVEGFSWGLANTSAQVLIQMDADLSHDPLKVPELSRVALTGEVAIGSRYVPGGGVRNWGVGRRLLSRGGSFYASMILGLTLHDVTGGFKAWPRHVLESIDLKRIKSDGYAFQVEMSYLASRKGFILREVPIVFVDRRLGRSKMSFGIALEALWMIWRLRLFTRKNHLD